MCVLDKKEQKDMHHMKIWSNFMLFEFLEKIQDLFIETEGVITKIIKKKEINFVVHLLVGCATELENYVAHPTSICATEF
jgi:hypothetical protein